MFLDRQNSLSMLFSSRSLLSAFINGLTKNCAKMSSACEKSGRGRGAGEGGGGGGNVRTAARTVRNKHE